MALKLKSFETENGILVPEGYFKFNNVSYITYLPDESDAVLVCDGSIYYNKETIKVKADNWIAKWKGTMINFAFAFKMLSTW